MGSLATALSPSPFLRSSSLSAGRRRNQLLLVELQRLGQNGTQAPLDLIVQLEGVQAFKLLL